MSLALLALVALVGVLLASNVVLLVLLSRARQSSRQVASRELLLSLGHLREALEHTLGPRRAAEQISQAVRQVGVPKGRLNSEHLRQVNHLVRTELVTAMGSMGADLALASGDGESGALNAQLSQLASLEPSESSSWVRSWLHGLLRENPNGIVVLDRERTVLLFSPRAAALTGVPAAMAVGQPVENLPSKVRRLFEGLGSEEVSEHRLDGRAIVVRSRLLANQSRLVVLADLTGELGRAQDDRLSEMGRLTANVAHEIRSPLGGMLLAAHNLELDLEAPEHRERLGLLVAEGRRIEAIVHALLSYSRPDLPAHAAVSLAELAGEAAALVRLQHREKLRTLVLDVAPHLSVSGRASALLQVVVNLLSNAAAASPEGGDIVVSGGQDGALAWLDVWDTGPGVDAELEERIFDPFVTTKPRGEGVGLGLSISRQIAEAHEGRLSYARVDGRTRFRLELPASES